MGLNEIWVLVQSIQEYMEDGNSSTCVMSVLLHVKDLFAVVFDLQCRFLALGEGSLWFGLLEEQNHSLHWTWNHVLSPVFSTHDVLNGILIRIET